YFFTLGPYAAYWFTLQHEPMKMAPKVGTAADSNAAIIDSLPALLVGHDWQSVLDSGTRAVLERQALQPFLRRQRWFASKSREIRHAGFSDWTRIRGSANPAFLSLVSVEYADGWSDAYLIPLTLVSGEEAERAVK